MKKSRSHPAGVLKTDFLVLVTMVLAYASRLPGSEAAQPQVINFDVPGGVSGNANYSGQGALTDSGNNYWNAVVTTSPYATADGLWSDGVTASAITFTAPYGAGGGGVYMGDAQGANGTPAGLFAPFESDKNTTDETNTLSNVPAGVYDLYLYGNNGTADNSDRGTTFTVWSDLTPPVSLSTFNLPADYNTFVPGVNYVLFTNIIVGSGGVIDIAWAANPAATATFNPQTEGIFNGLQLVSLSSSAIPPTVTNSRAMGISATSATIGGSVVTNGGSVPSVTVYYGPADGGTNVGEWANRVLLGSVTSGAFSQVVGNLLPATVYYFTATAVNGDGTAWATPSQSFTTALAGLAQITNLPAANITVNTATLAADIVNTGGSTPAVTIFYGTIDGTTNALGWANSINLGSDSGYGAQTVVNLSSNTTYYFTAQASNSIGVSWATPSGSFVTQATSPVSKPVAVLTYKYDNARDGANTNEVVLTPANVNVNSFKKLFTYTVDGYVYAQPLYVPNLMIPGQGTHNVVFVATENDSIYAFDADNNAGTNGGLLWHANLGTALISVNNYGVRYHHNVLNPLIGITGTPVIDPVSGTLYVDTFCGAIANTNNGFHILHALNITNGTERSFSPVLVNASVPGAGVDATNGVVVFAGQNQMNRPALTLAGGKLFLAYGSYGDTDPFHGWVIGYNATNLVQLTNYVYASTPNATTNAFGVNAGEGAIWMGGDGLCVDDNTNLYFETANGSFSADTNGGDYADSFVKLSTTNQISQFKVADYFTPWDQASMAANDQDLGSGGPILLPDSAGSAAHPHLMIGAGKEGTLYLLDRDNMGQYIGANSPDATSDSQIVQELPGAIGGLFGSADYFNNLVFFQGSGDVMKAFGITNGVMTTSPVSQSTVSFSDGYTTPSISANGTSDAIAWVIQTDAYSANGPGILHAYNATNLSQELYNSSQDLTRDNPGGAVKYAVPVVANGKVYVRGEYTLSVYGVGIILPPPAISPNGGIYTNSVTVTLSDATNGTAIYYTLDGTTPATNSLRYAGPITLTNTVELNAIAAQTGVFNSAVSSASFINTSAIGAGTGLLGSYWASTTSEAFTNAGFAILPTLVRTDAMVNFNFGSSGPAASVGSTDYVVRWTGSIQPQFNESYAFYTASDDGVRLLVDGQLLINDWDNQPATVESNTITLKARQLYNIELDYYYQNDNGAQVSLSWSSPSIPRAIIPQTQLYPYTNPPPAIVLSSPADGSIYTASASVSIAANADAPYNPIDNVEFYANGSFLGAVSDSPNAPLYALTTTGLNPNPGGETANSSPVNATPSSSLAIALTTTNVEAAGTDWTASIWQTNGTGRTVAPVTGNTYALVFNGTGIGDGLNNTRVRSPAATGIATFPGGSLTLNTNTELRSKEDSNNDLITLNFPGGSGNPGLILNGGMLNNGSDGMTTITGNIQVTGQSYDSAQGESGGGGGLSPNPRAITISGYLGGTGNIVIMNCSTNLPQVISGATNTYSGQWIVQCGWLQAMVADSLGTNGITVDPDYTGYLTAMPNATSPNGPAMFEADYDLNSAGTLTLANGGMMNLHQNCTFAAVNIEGTSLTAGTYSYSELISSFPKNFLPGGSGSITVYTPARTPGPAPVPSGLGATAGNAQVSLSWNASPGATNYIVKRSTTNGGPYTNVASLTGTSYTDRGLFSGITYYYVVSAVSAPGYRLTAVATDGSGLSTTSAPVNIMVNTGSGLPYGLTNNGTVPAFLNMPAVFPAVLPGTLPALLSETGVFASTPDRTPAGGLIPYVPNTPLWSDGAQKSRYMAVPNGGGLITPDAQIAFMPTNSWTFPAGTVFVKNFDLAVNETNASVPLLRLETRLLVRDINGGVYGVTYKWRPDNSDADLLTTSSNEDILITNATGVTTQTWYYPSPADCLTCHTPVANYVLGVNTRQLNGNMTYFASGNTDNQLRTLNRLGLFYPAINEADITNFPQLSSLTNLAVSLQQRARSYLDANCAQCHQPGGTGDTFDARYDTPLSQQNITNYPAQLSLGIDNACIVKAHDVWRSTLLLRIDTNTPAIKMPPLARNLTDSAAVQVFTDWINSLPGIPALAPPTILPNGGAFAPSVTIKLQAPDTNAAVYYTLDGTLPTTNSFLYATPFVLNNTATLAANAFEANFNTSVAANALFVIQPLVFTSGAFNSNNVFQLGLSGISGSNYVLQATTNFINWTPLNTNIAVTNLFNLVDPNATNFPYRFYRVLQQ